MAQKTKQVRTIGYCPEGGGSNISPFDAIFDKKVRADEPGAMEQIDCLLMHGGTDIHPSFYREKVGKHTFPGNYSHPSRRDDFEWRAMLYCKAHDIPMIGLCRGAQFGTIFAGGSLVQHVTNHGGGNHQITTIEGEEMLTNSLHHQMMNPYGIQHKMLAWASPALSTMYLNGEDQNIAGFHNMQEPEIVYYPEIRFLAIQGHPEYASAPKRFRELCVELVREHLFNETVTQE